MTLCAVLPPKGKTISSEPAGTPDVKPNCWNSSAASRRTSLAVSQPLAVQGVALRKLHAGLAVQAAEHGPERQTHGGKRAGNDILDHLRGGHVSSPKSHEPEKAFLPFFPRLPFLLVSGNQTPSGFKTSVVVVPSRPPLNVRRVRK